MKRVERKKPDDGARRSRPKESSVALRRQKNGDAFTDPKKFVDGLMSQGFTSKQKFGDFSLHLEFLLSYMPAARGQGEPTLAATCRGA